MYNNKKTSSSPMKFKHFTRKGYALFACLGKEVIVGTLSVATLTYAKADGISTQSIMAETDSLATHSEIALDEVRVTGSRAPLTHGQAARMITVLEQKDIQAAPVQSINDLLKYAASVDVRQRGPIGAQTDISIRGGNQEQITILLNGINICDPQTGHNAFDFPVDVSDIERIEVLEGPAGRVFGTSSLLGAINIVTKHPKQNKISAHAEAGSYGYFNGGTSIGLTSGKWTNTISGNYTRSDGYNRNKAGRLNTDFEGAKAFYQGTYSDKDTRVSWHAGLSMRDFGSNTFYGTGSDDQFEHTFKSYTALQADTRCGKLHLSPSVYWNRNMDRFEYFRGLDNIIPEGGTYGVAYNYHRTDVYGVNLNSYFDWTLGRTAVCAELRNEDLVSTTLGEPLEQHKHIHNTDRDYTNGLNRTNISFTLEHNILLERFTLSAGIVAVKNSWNQMNMRVYPGIDASYRIGNNVKFYASYNTSLRMPSVTELYYSVGGHKADKNLKPEELQALEGGVKYLGNGITASASVFYNHCKNMIDWILDTNEGNDAVWKSVNFTKINTLGVEASLAMKLNQLIPQQHLLKSLDLSYTYMTQDKDEPANIQSRSTLEYLRHKFVANLDLNIWSKLDLTMKYRWQKRTGSFTRKDNSGGNAVVSKFKPYGLMDARLSWNADKYKLFVEANNVFNTKYYDFGSLPQPGTWIMAGASVDINL
ncbi:TonB-dependent receptor plug domain-containing protein [Prevotella sp.]|uniref:TonB-dependent receptor plug domain-containing protein n=1 Tax=Prevotella sp. TaxID=59823 RepID=UPI00307EFEDC